MQINFKKVICYAMGVTFGGGAICQAIFFMTQGCNKALCIMWALIGVIMLAAFTSTGNEK